MVGQPYSLHSLGGVFLHGILGSIYFKAGNRVKIAFLHHSFILGSGTDSLIYQYGKRLANQHSVTVFTFRPGKEYYEDRHLPISIRGIRLLTGQGRISSSVLAPLSFPFLKLWRLDPKTGNEVLTGLEELNSFDVVITQLYPMCLLPTLVKKRKFKWVHIEWSTPEGVWTTLGEKGYAKLAKWGEGVACKKADRFLVGSRFVQEYVKKEYGVASKFMYLDGIDFGLFDKGKYSNKFDTNNILFVGRVAPHRNLETLVKAFVLVKEKVPDATLTIVGSHPFKGYLRKLVCIPRTASLYDSIFYTGSVPWDLLPRYYADCSVYCSPSKWEGFLRCESYAFEKPMVGVNLTANTETLKEGGLGLDRQGPEELAWSLTYFLSNKESARDYGQKGYKWAKENLDLDVIVPNLVEELED